jgi:hypothetical protein
MQASNPAIHLRSSAMARLNSFYHIEVSEVTLPAYYASTFVNGDFSGIDNADEVAHVQSIIDSLASDGWHIVDVKRDEEGNGDEPRFTWCYQLYNAFGNASGGDVLDYVVFSSGISVHHSSAKLQGELK